MARVEQIDLNYAYATKVIDDYYGEGMTKLLDTDKKSEELTREKNELLLKLNDGDEDLDRAVFLPEKIVEYQKILREGYKKFGIDRD